MFTADDLKNMGSGGFGGGGDYTPPPRDYRQERIADFYTCNL